ncbi:hypothetical protein AMAG_13489 [Allomyces macrogynus ATCC 38327]|uniref:Transcription factor Opi1 n=1 Tax=Allomyces macrogynus (strain ATCC 38327) TaxID=578462 RepID=A0A0L0T2M4_ALLM3|nr:hypothetical protein AMAG_13489 [Allomyces macrogynus ATCC 38327]|eukprot:KNE68849.1 hypothetical protein AMAG_13489 [Allomyces macrogynus ATCC 38327]
MTPEEPDPDMMLARAGARRPCAPPSRPRPSPAHGAAQAPHFLSRVSALQLVNTSIKSISNLYASTKATSKVVQYSADVLEANVVRPFGAMAGRYLQHSPVVHSVDEFACRQFDRLVGSPPPAQLAAMDVDGLAPPPQHQQMPPFVHTHHHAHAHAHAGHAHHAAHVLAHAAHAPPPRTPATLALAQAAVSSPKKRPRASSSLHQSSTAGSAAVDQPDAPRHLRRASVSSTRTLSPAPAAARPVHRSRWQQMTAGAVAAAGAGAAVVSEESMKSLRYCLEWLQYATQQIDAQMTHLRNFLLSLARGTGLALTAGTSAAVHNQTSTSPSSASAPSDTAVAARDPMPVVSSSFPTLAEIKRDLAETLRRVVDVVGRYAGNFLAGDARARVRAFILSLPSRWASLNAPSPTTPVPNADESREAQRVLTFAAESADVLRSMQDIFGHSLATAEQWLGTLEKVPFVNSLVAPSAAVAAAASMHHHHQAAPGSPTIAHHLASMSLASPVPSPHLAPVRGMRMPAPEIAALFAAHPPLPPSSASASASNSSSSEDDVPVPLVVPPRDSATASPEPPGIKKRRKAGKKGAAAAAGPGVVTVDAPPRH